MLTFIERKMAKVRIHIHEYFVVYLAGNLYSSRGARILGKLNAILGYLAALLICYNLLDESKLVNNAKGIFYCQKLK